MERDTLLHQLEKSPEMLKDLLQSIPEERYIEDFGKEEVWSVYDHVNHLVLTQIMLLKRIKLFIEEEMPEIVPYIPDNKALKKRHDFKPISTLLSRFTEWRKKQLDVIKSADAEIWERKAVHPEYTGYSFKILIRHILLHDYCHFYRIEDMGFKAVSE